MNVEGLTLPTPRRMSCILPWSIIKKTTLCSVLAHTFPDPTQAVSWLRLLTTKCPSRLRRLSTTNSSPLHDVLPSRQVTMCEATQTATSEQSANT